MNEQPKQKLGELFELCIELNKPDFTVFCDYAGLINHIDIRVHAGGWNKGRTDERIGIYIDTDDESIIADAHKAKFELIDIHNKFRSEK